MSELEFGCLRAAVNIARNDDTVRRLYQLRPKLVALGFDDATVKVALQFWADYYKRKE